MARGAHGMDLRFHIDPETDDPHIHRHGVSEFEVGEVMASPSEDLPGRRNSRLAIGQTLEGRYLLVVYVRDPEPGSAFVVTAYELSGNALSAFRRRRRRRNR